MSFHLEQPPESAAERWSFSPHKLYGWLVGVAIAGTGALMCAAPAGVILGVPIAASGMLLALTFALAISATRVNRTVTYLLIVLGLALLVVGRCWAPVIDLIVSFQRSRTQTSRPTLHSVLGFPMMITGVLLVQLAAPWVRTRERLNYFRSLVAIVFIEGGCIALLVGSILTARASDWEAQPYWVWLGIPLSFGLGAGLRTRWRGFDWLAMTLLTGLALPLTWLLLRGGDFSELPRP